MKKLIIAAFVCMAISACIDPKDKEKAILNDVIKIHDKVMGNDERLMQNKMKLDTLSRVDTLTKKYNPQEKATMKALNLKLIEADKAMENWMQKFDPEQKGKSHDEIMAYLADQKKQIMQVDSMLNMAVKESTDYLNHLKK
ncbi:hypothetical protein [Mucilaginibacter sp.]|uniref:hypothetical protein n=1 Tax=Mucilaginibacter sp. TaxID=1882438 RepID=UPI0026257EFF|nr:hypothetical protein [Mucilaginibacter sp.]MDB4925364.1 hypothetical protein [Mucilaginibacter sp.]